jgi:diacylglycerol kinase
VTESSPPDPTSPSGKPRTRNPWRDKFRVAFRGIKIGVVGQSSFYVHGLFTVVVPIAAAVLNCDVTEWCLLLGCIGAVWTAELFNSTIETLFRGLDDATKERAWPCLDIAAGAVLTATITAVVIGAIIFLPKLAFRLGIR